MIFQLDFPANLPHSVLHLKPRFFPLFFRLVSFKGFKQP